jgi:type IV pilus assembly protein PilC
VTRILIAAGTELRQPAPWASLTLLGIVGAVAARRFQSSDAPWAVAADRFRLHIPIVGSVIAKTTIARFARTLGSLLHAGVDVVGALDASAQVVEGFAYRDGLRGVSEAIRRGETLVAPFEASGLFDATFLQLLRAGDESGSVDAMLLRLAQYYELDVETALSTLTTILEPFLICALGAAIGTIVASIIIPLYSQ